MKDEIINDIYKSFPNHNRFNMPKGIYRVTAGKGGESFLINGGEKIALYDCGMAFCNKGLIENIEKVLKTLGKENLDYILISHTHYDHLGALPYLLERWEKAVVVGSEKAKKVCQSKGAKATMMRLGIAARNRFAIGDEKKEEIKVEGIRIDKVVGDGDLIDLGEKKIMTLATKGHTDCSLSFFLLPDKILFASESTGVLRAPELMHTAILKNYFDTIESAKKSMELNPVEIIGNHYGAVPKEYTDRYFKLYIEEAEKEKNTILALVDKGLSYEEVLKGYIGVYWSEERGKAQPWEAFLENAKYEVRHIMDLHKRGEI